MAAALILLAFAALFGLPAPNAGTQQRGGVLRIAHRDSPSGMSIHERERSLWRCQ